MPGLKGKWERLNASSMLILPLSSDVLLSFAFHTYLPSKFHKGMRIREKESTVRV